MKNALRLLVPYLIAAALLSGIDLRYEWLSPLPPAGESTTPTEWYGVAGLRHGAVFLANHAPPGPAAGLSFGVHMPALFPIPIFAGAGAEGGGFFLSVWFIALVAWGVHMLCRALVSRKPAPEDHC